MDIKAIRKDFPILKKKVNGKPLVYLDNAATSQKPRHVIEAVKDFYENHNANLGRGVHTMALEATEMFEGARKKVAKFINAKPEEVIFTLNDTQAINMIALSYARILRERDRVVTTAMEHHSNYLPWTAACRRSGAELKIAGITDRGELDMADYQDKLGKNTKVAAATHISNVLGIMNPAKEMAKVAHEAGAVFFLDGAQSVPHMRIDVKELSCDFMAFSGHKMLGPTGVGVLYGKKELLEEMEPVFMGGGTVGKVTEKGTELLKPPRDFEAGTQNIAGVVGLEAAVEYLEGIGMGKVEGHGDVLNKAALKGLEELGADIIGPAEASIRKGPVTFNLGGIDHHDLALILDEQGIEVRSGQNCCGPLFEKLGVDGGVRASPYLYNTQEEVDKFLEVLGKLK